MNRPFGGCVGWSKKVALARSQPTSESESVCHAVCVPIFAQRLFSDYFLPFEFGL